MGGAPPDAGIPGIALRDTAEGLEPRHLAGFFTGWRRAPSPVRHLEVLGRSALLVVALWCSRSAGGRRPWWGS